MLQLFFDAFTPPKVFTQGRQEQVKLSLIQAHF